MSAVRMLLLDTHIYVRSDSVSFFFGMYDFYFSKEILFFGIVDSVVLSLSFFGVLFSLNF